MTSMNQLGLDVPYGVHTNDLCHDETGPYSGPVISSFRGAFQKVLLAGKFESPSGFVCLR